MGAVSANSEDSVICYAAIEPRSQVGARGSNLPILQSNFLRILTAYILGYSWFNSNPDLNRSG